MPKSADQQSRVVASSLPPALYRELEKRAAERRVTLSAVMREVLTKGLAPASTDDPDH